MGAAGPLANTNFRLKLERKERPRIEQGECGTSMSKGVIEENRRVTDLENFSLSRKIHSLVFHSYSGIPTSNSETTDYTVSAGRDI